MSDKHIIVIVDDEQDVLNSMKRVFRKSPFEVHTFDSGERAVEVLKDLRPDLIISDMRMPGMDGAEFLSQAKSIVPAAPRILLTGQADKEDTVRAINDGEIFAFVSKPWDNTEFLALAEDALARRNKEKMKNRALHTLKKMHDEVSESKEGIERELAEQSQENQQNKQATVDAYLLMEESFLNLLDMKQPGQRAFAHQLEEVVTKLAARLNVEKDGLKVLYQASRLHGLGKISVPDAVLEKGYSNLSESEKELYHAYPANGACTLIAIEAFSACSDILFKQQERLDGSGFPLGLKADELSPLNRLFNVALAYAELRFSPSVTPLPHDQAIHELNANAAAFDHKALQALSMIKLERELSDATKQTIVHVHGLKVGMVIVEDIYSEKNMLLLRGGTHVTEILIEKLTNLQRQMGKEILINVRFDPITDAD
ncbi:MULTISPECIES: HD domain-containing phosphohydrolase [unclassified Oleiphilus]|nr:MULTISPECIES: HD domain-containing phosphohydrolase [unclassified Oleiphilus]KZY68746.1 hypothetical protein A3738_04775 [Oleiphilus sp. HI0066]KZY69824.1 hypothetical protein A3739_07740 [Oleiphilus sp. HI0067]